MKIKKRIKFIKKQKMKKPKRYRFIGTGSFNTISNFEFIKQQKMYIGVAFNTKIMVFSKPYGKKLKISRKSQYFEKHIELNHIYLDTIIKVNIL